MGIFFAYILKSAICLSCFYLFYRWLLSKETFHRFNRIALLGILLLSLLIPFIEVTVKEHTEVNQTFLTIEQLLMMAEVWNATPVAVEQQVEFSLSWIQIGLLIYIIGILFFACRNIYSLCHMCTLLRSGKRENLGKKIILIILEKDIAPFSWMKYIVISQKDLEENGREILIHERAHIQNRHSWDLLVADICIFFQWFNPGAWLLKQELQNIHEYEADETVINEGVNAKEYQLLLIKKAVGTRLYSMANSFNHSKLKKRITMMFKEKSNPWARMKYLYVLPLAAVAVTAFARPEVSKTVEEISSVKVNDLAVVLQGEILKDTVKSKLVVVLSAQKKVTQKAVTKKEEAEKVYDMVEQRPVFVGGEDALRRYLSTKADGLSILKNKRGIVNVGFTVSEDGTVKDAQVLSSGEVTLNEEALRIVREMPTWIPGKQNGQPVSVRFSVPVRFSSGLQIRGANFHLGGKKPLVLRDGKEMTLEQIDEINPSTIESISVLKDSTAVKIYGNRGAEGVILITTKDGAKADSGLENESNDVNTQGKPDFLVSGTVVDNFGKAKPGVSILIPGTSYGTITDQDGHFKMKAFEGGALLFTYIGLKSVKIPVSSTMNVQMKQEVIRLLD